MKDPKTLALYGIKIRDSEANSVKIKSKIKKVFLGLFILLFIFLGIEFLGYKELKKITGINSASIIENLKNGRSEMERLNPEKAISFLKKADNDFSGIESVANKYGFKKGVELFSSILKPAQYIKEGFDSFKSASKNFIDLSVNSSNLKANGVDWFFNQKGALLIENLEKIHANTQDIELNLNKLKNINSQTLKDQLELGDSLKIGNTNKLLNSIIDLLNTKEEKRIVILFENPGELRPAGGFTGSYAETIWNNNGLVEIKIWDIYDPDGQLDAKIVPPKELQGLTENFGARDANWFFDFKNSAKKTLELLEKSKIYNEKAITFEGAIAVNINVLKSVLESTDDINLEEYNLKVNAKNFLDILQKEVEAGKDKLNNKPKKIIKVLFEKIIDSLKNLDNTKKEYLAFKIQDHIKNKDIMFYAKNFEIQSYLENLNIAGRVYEIPSRFNGDYLGITSSNIAGGKSDAVTNQKIKLESKISSNGRINNFLTIEKTHNGKNSDDYWYQKTNKSIIKTYLPRNSKFTYIKGNDIIPKIPESDYVNMNFVEDSELKNLEESKETKKESQIINLKESDKNVFEFWMNTPKGKTKKIELEYENLEGVTFPQNESLFEFVFDKQSGANTSFEYLIEAPEGYIWKESGSEVFNKIFEKPEGRTKIDLTLLEKHQEGQFQP